MDGCSKALKKHERSQIVFMNKKSQDMTIVRLNNTCAGEDNFWQKNLSQFEGDWQAWIASASAYK